VDIPCFNLVGAKTRIAQEIIQHFPQHRVYCEPFGGSVAVLRAKLPSEVEVINDINSDIINFFLQIRDNFDALHHKLTYTPYSHMLYRSWLKEFKLGRRPKDKVEWAARWFYLQDTCVSGAFGGGWGFSQIINHAERFAYKVDRLDLLSQRLRRVYIENVDYADCIKKWDGDETLFYIDPPYLVGEDYYQAKFDHIELSDLLAEVKGKVVLSYYDQPSIRWLYANWRVVEIETFKSSTLGEEMPRATELLLFNFEPYPLFRR